MRHDDNPHYITLIRVGFSGEQVKSLKSLRKKRNHIKTPNKISRDFCPRIYIKMFRSGVPGNTVGNPTYADRQTRTKATSLDRIGR